MTAIRRTELPQNALLASYLRSGAFTDCRVAEMSRQISLSELIVAFYGSAAFRAERWLLGALLGCGATAADIAALAAGTTEAFAAWTVEAREADQILLCDFQGKTRSWLMVEPQDQGTRVYFGSAVVTPRRRRDAVVFRALMGFHAAYSWVLLRSAVRTLQR